MSKAVFFDHCQQEILVLDAGTTRKELTFINDCGGGELDEVRGVLRRRKHWLQGFVPRKEYDRALVHGSAA